MSSIIHTIKLVAQAQAAIAEVRKYQDQIAGCAATVQKHEATLSGVRLLKSANEWTAAVAKLGGATKDLASAEHLLAGAAKLTASEKDRLNTTLTKAIEKYTALGQTAPTAMRELEKATRSVEAAQVQHGFSLKTLITGYVAGIATWQTAKAVFRSLVGFVTSSVESYAASEVAAKKLTAALTAQGQATPAIIRYYGQLQDAFQRTTVYSDDLIAEMQALLVQVGDVAPSQMQKALTAATDLASGLGIDLREATMMVAKAAEGQTVALHRLGLQTTDAKGKTLEFDEILDRIGEKFRGQAATELDTYRGHVKQLANEWDNLKEAIGQAVATDPFLNRAASGAAGLLSTFGALLKSRGLGGTVKALGTAALFPAFAGSILTTEDLVSFYEQFGPKAPPSLGPRPTKRLSPEALASLRKSEEQIRDLIYKTVPTMPNTWEAWSAQGIESRAPLQWLEAIIPPDLSRGRGLTGMPMPALPTQSYGYPVQITDMSKPGGTWGSLKSAFTGGLSLSSLKSTLKSDQFKTMALNYGADLISGWAAKDPTSQAKGALSGAASGAVAGAAFGPWGAAAGAVWGGISGAMGARSAKRKLEKDADAEIQALQAGLLATYGSIDAIREAGGAAGEALAGAWGDKNIAGLAHFKDLVEEFNDKIATTEQTEKDIADVEGRLKELRAQEIPGWQEMQSLAEKYGISLNDLGQNFKQLRTTDLAMGIVNDFERLVKGGADAAGVVRGMSEEISGVVQDSLKFGTEIPENMRPMIQSLIDQGLLLDSDKKKITDIGTLHFGERVKTDAELLTGAINELVGKLAELIDKLGKVPEHVDTTVTTTYQTNGQRDGDGGGDGDSDRGYALGTHGRYLDFGTGTGVTLHGRERVVTEAEGRREGREGDPAVLAALDKISRELSSLGVILPRAVRDTMLQSGRRR